MNFFSYLLLGYVYWPVDLMAIGVCLAGVFLFVLKLNLPEEKDDPILWPTFTSFAILVTIGWTWFLIDRSLLLLSALKIIA